MGRVEPSARFDRVLTASDVFRGVRRGALYAVALATLLGAAAYWVASRSAPIYSAEVGIIATQPGSQFRDMNIISPPTVDAGVYQSAILNGEVVLEALAQLDGERPSERRLTSFLESVRVRVDESQRSSTVWIEVRNPSASYAADAVNAITEQLVAWDRDRARRALDRSIEVIERSLADIDAELAAADATDAERIANLTSLREQRASELQNAVETRSAALIVGLLEPLRKATPPEEPIGPREVFSTLVAVLLGLVLGYGIQIVFWTLNVRVGGRDAVMATTGLPVLVEFPRRPRRTKRHASEAAGFFHANIALATRGAEPRVILLTSPMRAEEKAGVAIGLAENFARSGRRTLLVDADLRYPGITEWIGLDPANTVSFDTYLANPDEALAPVAVAVGGRHEFHFIPSFTSQRFPVDLLNAGFDLCLARWAEAYDVIVLDSAPVIPFADTLTIAPSCTGVVVSVSATRTTQGQLDAAVALLQRPQVNVLGVAITDARTGGR